MATDSASPFSDTLSPVLDHLGGLFLFLQLPFLIARVSLVVSLLSAFTVFFILMHNPKSPPLSGKFHAYPFVLRSSAWGAKTLLWLFGFDVRVKGREHVERCLSERHAPIIVMNHVSYLDSMALLSLCGIFAPVVRADMKNWPLIGPVISIWGHLGVPLPQPGMPKGSGLATALTERTNQADGPWFVHPPVLVFPEGTCTTGQQLLLFKSGGFVPGKPVLPVTVKYVVPSGLCCGWVYPKKTTAPFWRRLPGDLTHLLRILAATGKRLEITVDPPYVPSAEEKKNPSVYAAAVRSRMARMLNVPEQCSIACEDAKEFYKKKDGRPNGVIR